MSNAITSSSIRAVLLLSLLILLSQSVVSSARLFTITNGVNPSKYVVNIPRGGRTRPSSPASTTPISAAPSTRSSSAITEGLKNTLASGLAAACAKTILAPFDTIKTVQQHVEGGKSLGLLEAGRRITSRPGGVLNMYAGLGVAVLGSMPSVGLYFGVYSYCKRTIGPRFKECLGSERRDGKDAFCSDGALKNLSIVCSAAIGKVARSRILRFRRTPAVLDRSPKYIHRIRLYSVSLRQHRSILFSSTLRSGQTKSPNRSIPLHRPGNVQHVEKWRNEILLPLRRRFHPDGPGHTVCDVHPPFVRTHQGELGG